MSEAKESRGEGEEREGREVREGREAQGWRAAQRSPEELAERREERRARLIAKGGEARSKRSVTPSEQRADECSEDGSEEGLGERSQRRFTPPSQAEGPPQPWRSAQLSAEEQRVRLEERQLKAGERAERRAHKRAEAEASWERSKAKRTTKGRAREDRAGSALAATEREEREARRAPAHKSVRGDREQLERVKKGEGEGQDQQDQKRAHKRGKKCRPPINGEWLKQSGLRYLGRFSSSEANFRRVMKRKIKEAETRESDDPVDHERWVEEAVAFAYRYGGLNDAALATSLLKGMRRQGLSSAMIRQKLKRKGLSDEQIRLAFEEREEALDPQLDQLSSAARAARKRRLGPWGPSGLDYPARQKQLAALARRGFSFGVAQRVLSASLEEAEAWADTQVD